MGAGAAKDALDRNTSNDTADNGDSFMPAMSVSSMMEVFLSSIFPFMHL